MPGLRCIIIIARSCFELGQFDLAQDAAQSALAEHPRIPDLIDSLKRIIAEAKKQAH